MLKAITVNTPADNPAHILAQDDAAIYNAFWGNQSGIAPLWEQFNLTVLSDTQITIHSGLLFIRGHAALIRFGDIEQLEVSPGVVGKNRNDLLVAEFNRAGAHETIKFKVLQGSMIDGEPVDPSLTQENIDSSGQIYQMAIYRLPIRGTSLQNPMQLAPILVPSGNALPKSGGTMAGAINMDGKAITNLPDPTNDKDAVTKKYVDDNTTTNALNSNTPNAEEADPNTFMGGVRLTKHANCPTTEYYYVITVKYTDNCRCQFAVRYTDGAIMASRSCYSSESDTVNWRPWTMYTTPVMSSSAPSGSGIKGQLWIQY